jgi:hypothetical protein
MAFIEHCVAGGESNWCVPNSAGVEALLRSAGFEVLLHPEHESYVCIPPTRRKPRGVICCEWRTRSASLLCSHVVASGSCRYQGTLTMVRRVPPCLRSWERSRLARCVCRSC